MNKKEHLLICLAEECAEVQHAVSKALRFGLDVGYPGTDRTNAHDIAKELLDLFAVVSMLEDFGVIAVTNDPVAIARKRENVISFMEYAEQRGTITEDKPESYGTIVSLHP